jgi:outer membrane protein
MVPLLKSPPKLAATLIGILLSLFNFSANAENTLLEKASVMIKNGKSSEAYSLLSAEESNFAGDAELDYLFATAAIQTKNYGNAVFALERLISVNPNNTIVHLDFAKVLFELGEFQTAKEEIQKILASKISKSTTEECNKILASITKKSGDTTKYSSFIEFGLGHDNNINSATSLQSVLIPPLGGVVNLNPNYIKMSDNFYSISGGAGFKTPISNTISIFGNLSLMERSVPDHSALDTGAIDSLIGVNLNLDKNNLSVSYQDNKYSVGDNQYRHAYGFNGQWQREIDNTNQITLFGQANRLSYASQHLRDADRFLVGGGYTHIFSGNFSPILLMSAYTGREIERNSLYNYVGNAFYGLRAVSQISFGTNTTMYASGSYENRDYNGHEPTFLIDRTDRQYDFNVGIRYLAFPSVTIKPQLSYTKNDSNFILGDFDRTVLSISIRKDFNWQ